MAQWLLYHREQVTRDKNLAEINSPRCTFQLFLYFEMCVLIYKGLRTRECKEHLVCWVQSLDTVSNMFQRLYIQWLSCRFKKNILGVFVFSCFTTLQRLTLFYLCSITFLCFVLSPDISLSYNALENLCSRLFLSYAHWKLPESQNRAISHFQYWERIYLSSIGSGTFSESLNFSCFSIYTVAGTTWESSNLVFLFMRSLNENREYPAAG